MEYKITKFQRGCKIQSYFNVKMVEKKHKVYFKRGCLVCDISCWFNKTQWERDDTNAYFLSL